MITFAKIGNTHFNVSKNGTVVFSGALNVFALVKAGKSVILNAVETGVKFKINLDDTAEDTMNDLMQALAAVVFVDYIDPIIAGDAIIYDASGCYAIANDKLKIDLIAPKGVLMVTDRKILGKVGIQFKVDNGVVLFEAYLERNDAVTLWDDTAKALSNIDYTPPAP